MAGETSMEEVTLLQEEGEAGAEDSLLLIQEAEGGDSLDKESSEEAGETKEDLEEDLVPESQNPSETEGDP